MFWNKKQSSWKVWCWKWLGPHMLPLNPMQLVSYQKRLLPQKPANGGWSNVWCSYQRWLNNQLDTFVRCCQMWRVVSWNMMDVKLHIILDATISWSVKSTWVLVILSGTSLTWKIKRLGLCEVVIIAGWAKLWGSKRLGSWVFVIITGPSSMWNRKRLVGVASMWAIMPTAECE